MWRTNKKALVCLAVGSVVVVTIVSLAVWAIAGELLENPSPNQAIKRNLSTTVKSLTRPTGSLAERLILDKTSAESEGVRIFAMVNTGSPVPISQTQLERERSEMRQSIEEPALLDELIELQARSPPAPINSDSHSTNNEPAINLPTQLKSNRSQDIPSLLDVFSQYLGVDLAQEEPYLDDDRSDLDPPAWLSLSYLAASIFLLKQMDTLLQMQPVNSREFRTRLIEPKPWSYNSLNLLFVEPANSTDVGKVIRNDAAPMSLKEYLWAAHNMYVASQQPDSLECIWTVYCEEINIRAAQLGMSGAMARMNGVVMEMMSGLLSPPAALGKLARSIFHWNRVDCGALFPMCPPEHAVQYLVQLATTPFKA